VAIPPRFYKIILRTASDGNLESLTIVMSIGGDQKHLFSGHRRELPRVRKPPPSLGPWVG
jgi:hypothetical protein